MVVGLGNPGHHHANTRHNIGFDIANELGKRWEFPKAKHKFGGLVTEGKVGGNTAVAVLLPLTYMNDSGRSVNLARGAYKLQLPNVLVIHDEIELQFGEVRFRLGGGLGGHNGLRSIRHELGDPNFGRVRAGVGRPDHKEIAAYVLSRFTEPHEQVEKLIDDAAQVTEKIVLGEFELAKSSGQ